MRTLKLATRWDHEYRKWSLRTIAMATIHKIQAKALNGLKSWYGSRICWWLHSTSPWLRSRNDACQQAVCVFSSTKEISGLHTEMEGFVLFGPSVLRRIGNFLLPFLLQVGIRWPPPILVGNLCADFAVNHASVLSPIHLTIVWYWLKLWYPELPRPTLAKHGTLHPIRVPMWDGDLLSCGAGDCGR